MCEYQKACERELASWPGVTVQQEKKGRHVRVILEYQNRTRFVVRPTSPSDGARGAKNHVRDIRHTLLQLGATKH